MYVDSNPAADGGMRTRVRVLRGSHPVSWIAILVGMAIMFACPPLGVALLIVIVLIGIWQ